MKVGCQLIVLCGILHLLLASFYICNAFLFKHFNQLHLGVLILHHCCAITILPCLLSFLGWCHPVRPFVTRVKDHVLHISNFELVVIMIALTKITFHTVDYIWLHLALHTPTFLVHFINFQGMFWHSIITTQVIKEKKKLIL